MKRRIELIAAAFAGAGLALLAYRVVGPSWAAPSIPVDRGSGRASERAPQSRSPLLPGSAGVADARAGADAAGETSDPLESLRDALEAETIARETLASDVELIRTVLEQLIPSLSAATADGASDARGRSSTAGIDGSFDVAALEAVGISAADAAEVRETWEAMALARLDVTDQASREGWIFTGKHRQQVTALETELRSDLGESRYDQMLYATGQPNRVAVRDVLGGSAASVVGIQKGDLVRSYDGVPVFKPQDLRRATTEGRRGDMVTVGVQRGSQQLTISLPRGPIGIVMSPQRVSPQP